LDWLVSALGSTILFVLLERVGLGASIPQTSPISSYE
jgi:hypothetical protein